MWGQLIVIALWILAAYGLLVLVLVGLWLAVATFWRLACRREEGLRRRIDAAHERRRQQ